MQRISDGDTITATSADGTKFRLRLLGIDAPEIPHDGKPGHPFGEEARDYLDHLIGGKTVREDATDPTMSTMGRLVLVQGRARRTREIRQELEAGRGRIHQDTS